MCSAILASIGDFMPKFHPIKYAGKLFKLAHPQRDIRNTIPMVPYFWDSEVSFDLLVNISSGERRIDEFWDYEQELCDLDDKPLRPAVKEKIHICNIGIRRKLRYWSSGKLLAIKLGYLLPNKHYRLYITLTNSVDGRRKYLAATFTIKDRDEYYMQIFLILFSIAMALFFSFLAKGCGL